MRFFKTADAKTRWGFGAVVLLALVLVYSPPAWALEKYGRPLPPIGEVGEEGAARQGKEEQEDWLRGYLLIAPFVDNPTFAARPDNTGLAALRYMVCISRLTYTSNTSNSTLTEISSQTAGPAGSHSLNGTPPLP